MSDEPQMLGGAISVQAQPHPHITAGSVLRNARETLGLHIGALAGALKVPVKKLEALESDRLDLLPDLVFARALAASVCRTLNLDPASVLKLLPGQATPPLQPGIKISTASFDRPGMGWRVPLFSRMPAAVVLTASVLVVAALGLLFLPSLDSLKMIFRKLPAEANGAASVNNATAVTETTVARASVEPTPPLGSQADIVGALVLSVGPIATPASAIGGAGTNASSEAVADVQTEVRATAESLVVFKARGASWVEVTDASGVVQLRKTLASGQSASASGRLPLAVIVGRADTTDVLVLGKSFDLGPLTKDNVARFQIKQ